MWYSPRSLYPAFDQSQDRTGTAYRVQFQEPRRHLRQLSLLKDLLSVCIAYNVAMVQLNRGRFEVDLLCLNMPDLILLKRIVLDAPRAVPPLPAVLYHTPQNPQRSSYVNSSISS